MRARRHYPDGIYKRGTTWWATWSEAGSTVRQSLKVKDRKAALDLARQLERDRANPAAAAARKATLGDAVDALLADLRRANRPEGTINMYETKTKNLVTHYGSGYALAGFSPATVEEYFLTRAEVVGGSTLFKEWAALSRVLKRAKRYELFAGDVPSLKPEWVVADYTPRETFLSWEQIPRLLAELEPAREEVVRLIVGTGARWGEAMRFQPGDLDREHWQIRIRGTKTKGSAKTLGVPECMQPILTGVRGPFAPWAGVNASLERACRRAQLRLAAEVEAEGGNYTPLFPRVTPNDLRRTFSSLLVQGGAPLDVVAKLMRHASMTMVFKTYGQHTPESLARLAVPPVYQTQRTGTDSVDEVDSADLGNSGTSQFRRVDSNHRKRNQKTLGRRSTSPDAANDREIATGGYPSLRGVPQAFPILLALVDGLVLERARWDILDAFVLAVGDA